MEKKISVIITNHNYARFLEQCISSVVNSDFELNQLEIIVIDDASTDNSIQEIQRIMKDCRVELRLFINDTNLQVIRSRNRGIKHAIGEFVFILDADNYLGPDCLQKHCTALESNPDAVACYAPVQEFSHPTGEELGVRSYKEFDYDTLLKGNYIDAMAMFRRDKLIAAGMYNTYLPPDLWEDYELWLRLGSNGSTIVFIPGKPLSHYRIHPESKLATAANIHWHHVVQFLRSYYPLRFNYILDKEFNMVRYEGEPSFHFFFTTYQSSYGNNETPVLTEFSGTVDTLLQIKLHEAAQRSASISMVLEEQMAVSTQITHEYHQLQNLLTEKENLIACLRSEMAMIHASLAFRLSRLIRNKLNPKILKIFTNLLNLNRSMKGNLQLLSGSPYFDRDFYLAQNPDVKSSRVDPELHYLIRGGFEGRNPSSQFNSSYYLHQNKDVAESGLNPLVHYLRYGKKELRHPLQMP